MDITALASSLSATFELGKLIVNERDTNKLSALQHELSEKIIDAQTQLSQVLGTVIEQQRHIPVLEERIRELEREAAEKERYVLDRVGNIGDFFVYRLRAEAEDGEVDHFLCQPCFDAGKKGVLVRNHIHYLSCPLCNHGAYLEEIDPDTRTPSGFWS